VRKWLAQSVLRARRRHIAHLRSLPLGPNVALPLGCARR
jgi:hypothetical protein